MNGLKKWISLALALTLLLGCMSFAAAASADFKISGNTLLAYTGTDANVTIPAEVTVIGSAAFKDNLSIQTVDLNKATTIYTNAFSGCKNLTTVTNLDKVTKLYNGVFYNCTNLANGVTLNSKLTAIPDEAFMGCVSLVSITIPETVKTIGMNAFNTCTNLYNVTIPSNVASIGEGAFQNCLGLTEARISGSVTTVGTNAFATCPKLKIVCYKGSSAETYAKDNGIRYESLQPVIDSITLGDKQYTLIHVSGTPGTVTISKTIKPDIAADAEVGWTSSSDAVATVDITGKVTTVAQGAATVFATSADVQAVQTVDQDGTVTITVIGDKKGAVASTKIVVLKPVTGGWQYVGGDWYYCDNSSSFMKGWMSQNNRWYYFHDTYGYMLTGAQILGGKVYYFHPTSGEMVTGWVLYPEGWRLHYTDGARVEKEGWYQFHNWWYYIREGGNAVTGWQFLGGNTYYFDPASYAMRTGWFRDPADNTWHYLGETGAQHYEWLNEGGNWYYMHPNGAMAVGWQLISGNWYYFTPGSGHMYIGWLKDGGKWYYLRGNGAMATGWLQDNGKWYYLQPSNGAMLTGRQVIGGVSYNFGTDGALQ